MRLKKITAFAVASLTALSLSGCGVLRLPDNPSKRPLNPSEYSVKINGEAIKLAGAEATCRRGAPSVKGTGEHSYTTELRGKDFVFQLHGKYEPEPVNEINFEYHTENTSGKTVHRLYHVFRADTKYTLRDIARNHVAVERGKGKVKYAGVIPTEKFLKDAKGEIISKSAKTVPLNVEIEFLYNRCK